MQMVVCIIPVLSVVVCGYLRLFTVFLMTWNLFINSTLMWRNVVQR